MIVPGGLEAVAARGDDPDTPGVGSLGRDPTAIVLGTAEVSIGPIGLVDAIELRGIEPLKRRAALREGIATLGKACAAIAQVCFILGIE